MKCKFYFILGHVRAGHARQGVQNGRGFGGGHIQSSGQNPGSTAVSGTTSGKSLNAEHVHLGYYLQSIGVQGATTGTIVQSRGRLVGH